MQANEAESSPGGADPQIGALSGGGILAALTPGQGDESAAAADTGGGQCASGARRRPAGPTSIPGRVALRAPGSGGSCAWICGLTHASDQVPAAAVGSGRVFSGTLQFHPGTNTHTHGGRCGSNNRGCGARCETPPPARDAEGRRRRSCNGYCRDLAKCIGGGGSAVAVQALQLSDGTTGRAAGQSTGPASLLPLSLFAARRFWFTTT